MARLHERSSRNILSRLVCSRDRRHKCPFLFVGFDMATTARASRSLRLQEANYRTANTDSAVCRGIIRDIAASVVEAATSQSVSDAPRVRSMEDYRATLIVQ